MAAIFSHVLPVLDGAGRVVGGDDQDRLRLGRHRRREGIGVDLETAFGVGGHGLDRRSGQVDDLVVDLVMGIGGKEDIARAERAEEGDEHSLLRSGGDDDLLLGIVDQAVLALQLAGDGGAQFRHAVVEGVVDGAAVKVLLHRIDCMLRRGQVWRALRQADVLPGRERLQRSAGEGLGPLRQEARRALIRRNRCAHRRFESPPYAWPPTRDQKRPSFSSAVSKSGRGVMNETRTYESPAGPKT